MKHIATSTFTAEEVIAITCDICVQRFGDPSEMQAFLHIDKSAGYGSIFGDGTRIRCDICQTCLQEILGAYLKLEDQQVRA